MFKRGALALTGAAVLAVGLSACAFVIPGSGRVASQTRLVSGFHEVTVSDGAILIVKQTGQESLRIVTDDNLIDQVRAEVQDGKLRLGFNRSQPFASRHGLRFEVEVKSLSALSASGGSRVEASGIATPTLRVEVSGGGRVTARGTATKQEVSTSGGATYDGRDLGSRSARVEASGGAHSVVNASDQLDARASGGAHVEYLGSPRLQRETSGGGSVRAY
jgi:hypothetical protein